MLEADRNAVRNVLRRLGNALERADIDAVLELFSPDGYWRDLVSFTWNIKTLEGPAEIRRMLESSLVRARPRDFRLPDHEAVRVKEGVIEASFEFETSEVSGLGRLRLRDGKIWTLLTTARSIHGFEERRGRTRPPGLTQGVAKDRHTWADEREAESRELGISRQPYVIIVGGGQCGIALAARLRQLEVPTLILERNPRPGDSWRNRYKTLTLQDPVWYDHLPYLNFPEHWPVYSPKDKLGDWLEMYASVMELNFWGSTEVERARFDEESGVWEVTARRAGQPVTLQAAHLVLATGMSGRPRMPSFPGADTFCGDQHHSSRHPGPDAYAGKKAVVVGSNNSAHDIAQALWEKGADVTLVQRSSTLVVKQKTLMEYALKPLYSEDALAAGITVDKADLINASTPYALMGQFQRAGNKAIQDHDKDFYADLARVGFRVNWGPDQNTGVFARYLSWGAGYYIDIGASELVIDGSIALKSQVDVAEIKPSSISFSDGSELAADLIVYATGYEPMQGWVVELLGQDVADRVGPIWGLGSGLRGDEGPWEGELRNMWKPTKQAALWFQGGNLAQSRLYSQFLAMQLKARFENLPTPVFE